jgi:molybdopterin-guanine dinucleotide biosynthesis protein A
VDVAGAILAGGAASRFGGVAKGLAQVGGTSILARLRDAFRAALGREPVLIANAPDAGAWAPGLSIHADVIAGLGALGGILTAVRLAPAPVVVVAWDMPFVPAGLIRELADRLRDADAVLPESEGPRGLEPLCAGYGPAVAPAIDRALARGDRRAVAFHDDVVLHRMPLAQVARHGPPARSFFNVNTPEDLERAEGLWRASSQ